jgi:hypothetical protein
MSEHFQPSTLPRFLPVLAGERMLRLWLIVLTGGYYLTFALWPALFSFYGLDHSLGWFLDSYAILASNDAVAAGLNPWEVNPLDVVGRPHVYSQWWLELSRWGFTREDNFLLGGLFVTAFFVVVFGWLRPRSKLELAGCLAVIGSPPVLFAVERANNDLLVCALMVPAAAMISSERAWIRWLALVPVVVATGLKFYPAVAMLALVAAPTRRESWMRFAAGALLLALLAIGLRDDFMRIKDLVPSPRGLMTVGGGRIFVHLGFSAERATACAIAVGVAAMVVVRPWRWLCVWSPEPQDRRAWLGFILGASLLTGCFFAGTSYFYRLVFAVMLTPMLWRLMRGGVAIPTAMKFLARATGVLLLIILWLDMFVSMVATRLLSAASDAVLLEWSYRLAAWGAPVEWAFCLCLLCFVTGFIHQETRWLFKGAEDRRALW